MELLSRNLIGSIIRIIYAVCFLLKLSVSIDSITASEFLKDGNTLISNDGCFELGFFRPGSSNGRYLGIWYRNIPIRTVVWVANRENPVGDEFGLLKINNSGSLVIYNGNNSVVWSSNSNKASRNSILQLLDSGNLVLRDGNLDDYLWQSFDYPSDTQLAGMRIGWDSRSSLNRHLSAWKSFDDPSPGELSSGVELNAYPQMVMFKGKQKYYRGGPWNGLRFSGAPELRMNPLFNFKFVWNEEEACYSFQLWNKSTISRLVLNETESALQRYVWVESDRSWKLYVSMPRDYCDRYGLCGDNGICVISGAPVCQCLKGFVPKSAQRWNSMDWSEGCIREEPLECGVEHNFVKHSSIRLPDTARSWANRSMNIRECREACLKNCSCTAYANSDISGRGSGCVLWFGNLFDIRHISNGGQDLYIRMRTSGKANRSVIITTAIVVPFASLGLVLVIYYCFRRKRKAKRKQADKKGEKDVNVVAPDEDMELPLLDLATVLRATDNFSTDKKLGEGGFGPVYKGLLMDGQSIAVKRLSKDSGQGVNEFKNEVNLIAKLQHRNLVKLVSCCIASDEKILIYEYMPNGSLDSILFDPTRASELDWSKRFDIICGIARGLLYLHQDSILRIIHRDLKASNVLLDSGLNPKISDFGLARAFGEDRREEKTKLIVGTYGYMAPEYALLGLFSVKSDVFSFGVLLLEIVSGKKNKGFDNPDGHCNLIGYVWKLWIERRPWDLICESLDEKIQPDMIRCIHVGLLCIQKNPQDRPNMSTVVVMLNGDGILPHPKEPGFLIDMFPSETCSSNCSVYNVTITAMQAR